MANKDEITKKKTALNNEIIEANDLLFETELEVEGCEREVSKARSYLAAEKTDERILELRGAIITLNVAKQKLAKQRAEFEEKLKHYYEKIYS